VIVIFICSENRKPQNYRNILTNYITQNTYYLIAYIYNVELKFDEMKTTTLV
jgi:hypothetical protein